MALSWAPGLVLWQVLHSLLLRIMVVIKLVAWERVLVSPHEGLTQLLPALIQLLW